MRIVQPLTGLKPPNQGEFPIAMHISAREDMVLRGVLLYTTPETARRKHRLYNSSEQQLFNTQLSIRSKPGELSRPGL